MRLLRSASLSGLLLGGCVAGAGHGLGAGPVFAVSSHGTVALGWEAGTMMPAPLARLSAGGSYRFARDPKAAIAYHYVAFEPWLLLGATLGIALGDLDRLGLAAGMWEGVMVPITKHAEVVGDCCTDAWMFSFAFGFRSFGSASEFYLAPKIWRYSTLTWYD
jgi:hypothetical protein